MPKELVSGPKLPAWRGRALTALAVVTANLSAAAHADESNAVEPTVGEAVATDRAPADRASDNERESAPRAVTPPPAQQPSQAPTVQPTPSPGNARTMLEAVRAAAARQLVPAPSAEDLRLRTLDTSFPAEQPELEMPPPAREVIAEPVEPVSPREPSRRTVVRVVDGVTVLTNVTDIPNDVNPQSAGAISPRPVADSAASLPAPRTAPVDSPREVSVNANALSPASKTDASTSLGLWLWVLGGVAALLLVPIGVLLSRPVRNKG